MEGKTVERGYLGFVPRQLSREFAMDLGLTVTRGVMVSHVLGKSPAGRAGLRAFDIVKSLNGEEILGVNRLQQLIARLKPGEPAELTVVRGAQTLTLTVTPTARPKNAREREKAGPPRSTRSDESRPKRKKRIPLGMRFFSCMSRKLTPRPHHPWACRRSRPATFRRTSRARCRPGRGSRAEEREAAARARRAA